MTEILCDKVLITSLFKFKISTTFYDIYDFLKFIFQSLSLQVLFSFVFINKIFMLTYYEECKQPKKTDYSIYLVSNDSSMRFLVSNDSSMCFLVYW